MKFIHWFTYFYYLLKDIVKDRSRVKTKNQKSESQIECLTKTYNNANSSMQWVPAPMIVLRSTWQESDGNRYHQTQHNRSPVWLCCGDSGLPRRRRPFLSLFWTEFETRREKIKRENECDRFDHKSRRDLQEIWQVRCR